MSHQEVAPPARERNWDAFAAVIAAFIGLLALLVSAYTAYLQRKQAKAQVWPWVQLFRYGSDGTFGAENTGIGPARVRAVRVTVDGRPVREWGDVMKAIGYPGGYSQSQISGRVLPPGSRVDILDASKGEERRKMFDQVTRYFFDDRAEHRIGLVLCYCSVLDDCWMTAIGQTGGLKVDVERELGRCPIVENDSFRE
jgi:hypothetical protein